MARHGQATLFMVLLAGFQCLLARVSGQTDLIVAAGFAEIAAGSIAMGLGGYLAARGDAEHYADRQGERAGITS